MLSHLERIHHARQLVLQEGLPPQTLPVDDRAGQALIEPWVMQSWQRSLSRGHDPGHAIDFVPVSHTAMREASEANRQLVQAARPLLRQLGRALEDTHYFAILANPNGVIVDRDGPIDHGDRRVTDLVRIGNDLSEPAAGVSAISGALRERRTLTVHRGEHFFDHQSVYTCIASPLLGPDGQCAGALSLAGVEVDERPELRHLSAVTARQIENALLLHRPHYLLLRLNWPETPLGTDGDGLVGLDADGRVISANRTARQMLPVLQDSSRDTPHIRDLFVLPWKTLYDHAGSSRSHQALETLLWSGLRLAVRPSFPPFDSAPIMTSQPESDDTSIIEPLRDVQLKLIHQAIADNDGNVAQAARQLGISRATIYRRLNRSAV